MYQPLMTLQNFHWGGGKSKIPHLFKKVRKVLASMTNQYHIMKPKKAKN